ncbi:DUF559 domain-containing protein [Rhodococcus sp. NPDC006774]|uniref:endonuclease domain-containing protein n=1 Tax=Rhodococcus sp. NPDC006774 TaxID=3157186 RepID=UPI0033E0C196
MSGRFAVATGRRAQSPVGRLLTGLDDRTDNPRRHGPQLGEIAATAMASATPSDTRFQARRRGRDPAVHHARTDDSRLPGGTPRDEAELLIDERLKFGLDPASLLRLLERFPGRRGNAELARQVRLAVTRFASEPERSLGRALHRIGLYLEINAAVGPYICDLVDRRSRTIIEVDGREFHSAAGVFSKDRRRQNALVLDRWLVLRYSAFDVLAAPDVIAGEIASVIRRRRESRR